MRGSLSSRFRSFLRRGTRHAGGYPRPSASTSTREHGTRTPATGISGECNSFLVLGDPLVGSVDLTALALANSYTVRISSTGVMATLGESGGQLVRADFDDAWERANREALR